ncbi:MAG: hypothetical protein HXK15_07520, partial [Actinomyces sp.]|nr:hypothetical protein [Actinomyces sp.]
MSVAFFPSRTSPSRTKEASRSSFPCAHNCLASSSQLVARLEEITMHVQHRHIVTMNRGAHSLTRSLPNPWNPRGARSKGKRKAMHIPAHRRNGALF